MRLLKELLWTGLLYCFFLLVIIFSVLGPLITIDWRNKRKSLIKFSCIICSCICIWVLSASKILLLSKRNCNIKYHRRRELALCSFLEKISSSSKTMQLDFDKTLSDSFIIPGFTLHLYPHCTVCGTLLNFKETCFTLKWRAATDILHYCLCYNPHKWHNF